MSKPLKATELRANLFKILDEILETGEPREILRGRQVLVISPATFERRLDELPRRSSLVGITYDELPDFHWDYEPDPELFGDAPL